MYIPEFWCGVFLTIGVEMLSLIAYGIYLNIKKK